MKYLILVGDGMGDHPVAELGGKTPLEAAKTPMMDELCQKGELFLNNTIPDGYPPGSDVANMSLLGYSPALYYTGRSPLEAASMGVELSPDETAFRCNMVTLDKSADGKVTMVDFSAGHITNQESHELIAALEAECSSEMFHFHPGVSYRHLMVLNGELPGITTVPPHDYIEKDVTEHYLNYFKNPQWKALLEKVEKILANHPVNLKRIEEGKAPANMIWLWGEGKMPSAPTLVKRFDISGSMISAVDLLKGLGVVGGLSVIDVPGATGYIDTNYEGKAQAAIDSLKTQDFTFVHLEGPDEAGHKGSLEDKLTAIEDFDSRIVKPIYEALQASGEAFRMVITMDHFTPLAVRTHTLEHVPTILFDSRNIENGSGRNFNEREANAHDQQMHNGIVDGHTMIEKLLER
ncbi:cofactor-independent phosphoglycerate mutase [Desulfosediminicola flagellatus]|uniref:cofactor-independent phosphoglycerate mutase n=1 Tax=Desulfosediminicola flagellatus TaxID=2569541 RepID=UPI0010AC929C|nr:cofactor-independent phosphoglycerate mutase [Desulfosediminicola flagellatus]